MTRDRDSLHVEAAKDADAAVALVLCAMAAGVRDTYPDTNVTAHDIDGPWTWTEATYPEPSAKAPAWQRLNDAALRFVTGWPTVSTLTAVALFWAAMFGAYKLVALALQVFAQ